MTLFKSSLSAKNRPPDLLYTVAPEDSELAITLEGLDSLSPASTVEARKNAEAIVRVQEQGNVARLGRERDHAKHALEEANARFADASDREEAIRKEMDSPLRPNYLQTTLYTVCVATALSCEYALCYQTLPPLLGVPLETWQAYALGAAPVAAAVAIEMILDYLYGVISRLEAMTGRWVSGIAAATLILCALGVLLLNGKMVWAVAFAREEAARLLTTLADYTETPLTINQDIVTAAILAVSFVVVVNAAILLQRVMHDFHNIGLRHSATRLLNKVRRETESARENLRIAKNACAEAERNWERREEITRPLNDALRSKLQFRIQQILDQSQPPEPSLDDMISSVLASTHLSGDVFRFRQKHRTGAVN